MVLDVLVQSRRDKRAAERLLRKPLKRQCRAPRVMGTDKLASYGAARREVMPGVEHRRHKGLNNRAENLYGAFCVKHYPIASPAFWLPSYHGTGQSLADEGLRGARL